MKKLLYLFIAMSLITFTSCDDDDDDPTGAGETKSASVDATSKTTWNYFSLKNGTIVGTGEETETDNEAWFTRTDWDIAICGYKVRTNSGAATSVGSQGGVYTCDETMVYGTLEEVPVGATFASDKEFTDKGMGGTAQVKRSTAQVIQFKLEEDGSKVMPPVYLPSPVYIFKTADGQEDYKVNFIQYKDADGNTGHVEFEYAILY